MGENNLEINKLFESIKKGLEHYSVSELNAKINEVVEKKAYEKFKGSVEYVIEIVCDEFDTNELALVSGKNDELQGARFITWSLLHYALGMPLRRIAIMFNKKNHNSIVKGIFAIKSVDLLKAKNETSKELRYKYDIMYKKVIEECLTNNR